MVSIYRARNRVTSFGARISPGDIDDMDLVACACFIDEAQRERDLDFADRNDFRLTRKISVHRDACKDVDKDCKALVNGVLYDIEHIDFSAARAYIFLDGGEVVDEPA